MEDVFAGISTEGKTWPTRDMHLVVILIAKGFKPIDGEMFYQTPSDGVLM